MSEQLDPQLSRMFANYAPALDTHFFLSKMRTALDREQRLVHWRIVMGWSAVAVLSAAVAIVSTGPLGSLMLTTRHSLASLGAVLPIGPTPLNVTLVTALVALCMHRRIRALLFPF